MREANIAVPQSPSVVSNVARSASLLWTPARKNPYNRPSTANHNALASTDSIDSLPLTAMPNSPHTATSPQADDPFVTPSETEQAHGSPFADAHQTTSVMSPTAEAFRTANAFDVVTGDPPERPVLLARASSMIKPPPPKPQPLGLPPPKAPPPPVDLPPLPTSEPTFARADEEEEDIEAGGRTRWWHEYLCGCGEGPDRGGEHQVLRFFAHRASFSLYPSLSFRPEGQTHTSKTRLTDVVFCTVFTHWSWTRNDNLNTSILVPGGGLYNTNKGKVNMFELRVQQRVHACYMCSSHSLENE